MKSLLSILIIEDEDEICTKFKTIIDHTEGLSIACTTNSSYEGLLLFKEYLPHIIILDLELHGGSGSGIDFLKNLNQLNLSPKPYILVTTNNSSPLTHKYIREMGCDFVMSKYESDYSEQKAVDLILTMKDVILNHQISLTPTFHSPASESPASKKSQLHRMITSHLNQVGINPKVLGYRYLIDAIIIYIENPDSRLSAEIAKQYHKSEKSIERAMSNAINKAWEASDIEDLEKYYTARFDLLRGSPTIMEFVSYYADQIKSEMIR